VENIGEIKAVVDAAIEENQSIKDLKGDVAELKTDVAVLKTDVAELKITAKKHSQKLDHLDEKIHHQGLLFESMQKDLKLILDAVIPAKERVMQIDRVEDLVDQHDHRLNALEITLKDHLRDHHKS
jgi:hypothetical protein